MPAFSLVSQYLRRAQREDDVRHLANQCGVGENLLPSVSQPLCAKRTGGPQLLPILAFVSLADEEALLFERESPRC
jgi:hypothetical protein